MSASAPSPAASSSTPSDEVETVVVHSMSGSSAPTTIVMSTAAYGNNQRIFLSYETNFTNGARDDTEESFAETARKFSGWLKVDRAYYSQARPWIVRLLQTARQTVQRIAGIPEEQPFHVTMCAADLAYWVDAYVLMLRTVQPFDHHFVEDHLREQLAALFHTIAPPLPLRSGRRPVPAPLQIASASHSERRPQSSSGIVSSPALHGGRSSAGSPITFVHSPYSTSMPAPPHSAPPQGASSSRRRSSDTQADSSWISSNLNSSWRRAEEAMQARSPISGIPQPGLPRRSSSSGSGLAHSPTSSHAPVGASPTATSTPFVLPLVSSPTGFPASFPPPAATSPTRATTFQIPTSPRSGESVSAPQPAPASSVPLASTSASAPALALAPVLAPAPAPAPPGPASAKPKKARSRRKIDYAFLESDLEWYLEQKEAEKKRMQAEAAANAAGQGIAAGIALSTDAGTAASQIPSAVDAMTQPQGVAAPLSDTTESLQMEVVAASANSANIDPAHDVHDEPVQDVEMADVGPAPIARADDAPMVVDALNDNLPTTQGQPIPAVPPEDLTMPAVQDNVVSGQGELVAAPGDAPIGPAELVSADNTKMEVDTPTAGQDIVVPVLDNAIDDVVRGQITDPLAPVGQTTPADQSQPAEATTPPLDNAAQPSHDVQPPIEPQQQPSAQPAAQVPAPLAARVVDLSKVQSQFKPRSSKKGASELIVRKASSLINPYGLVHSKTSPPAPSASAASAPVASTSSLIPPIDTIASESGDDNTGAEADDETGEDDGMAPRKNNHWTHRKKHTSTTASASTSGPKSKKGPPGVKASDLKLPHDAAPTTTPSASEAEHEHSRAIVKGNKGRKGPPGVRSAPIGGGVPLTPTKRSTSGPSADAAPPAPPRSPLIIRIPSKQARSEMRMSSDSEDEEPLAVVVRRASEQRRKASAAAVPSSPTQALASTTADSSSIVPPSTTTGVEPSSSALDEASAMDVDQPEAEAIPPEHVEADPAPAPPAVAIGDVPDLQEILSAIKTKLGPKDGKVNGAPSTVAENVEWDTIDLLFPGISRTAKPDEDKYSALPLFSDGVVVLDFQRGGENVEPCEMAFELTEQQMAACNLWTSRYENLESTNTTGFLCVSIFCYSFKECANVDPGTPRGELFKKLKPITWPKRPRQHVKINDKPDANFIVTIHHTPRDNLLDITGDIRLGKNAVTIVPLGGDTYDVVYAIFLHSPTPRQMAELAWRRNEERKWQATLKRLSHFPSPLLDHIPGGRTDGAMKGTDAT